MWNAVLRVLQLPPLRERYNTTNFIKILFKFAIVLNVCENFGPFLDLVIITGQRKILCLADGLNDKSLGTKTGFENFFNPKSGHFSLRF